MADFIEPVEGIKPSLTRVRRREEERRNKDEASKDQNGVPRRASGLLITPEGDFREWAKEPLSIVGEKKLIIYGEKGRIRRWPEEVIGTMMRRWA